MRGAQVFPSWISTVKAKLGDGVDNSANVRGRSDTQIEQQQGPAADFFNAGDSSFMKAPRTVYKGHQMPVRCLAVMVVPNSEDTLLFSGGEDKLVFVWSLKTGEKVAEFYGHTQRVTSMCTYSGPSVDPLVISASWDERLRIWPVKTCIGHTSMDSTLSEKISSESTILKGHTSRVFGVTIVNRAGEAPFVASGSSDNTIRVWALPDGKLMYVLEDEEDVTWNLCVSSFYIAPREDSVLNGTVLISGCKNSTVRVWNHRANWADETPMASHPQSSSRVQGVIDLLTGKSAPARVMPDMVIANHPSAVHSLVPFEYQDEPLVATVCKDLDIRIFSLLTGKYAF
jgi:WD40 repeat protein